MRTIQIHPLSLAVGAVAVSAAFLLTAQTTPPAQTTWPPPKSMILNLAPDVYGGPIYSVPSFGYTTILTVPTDRWLTITGVGANNGANLTQLVEVTDSGAMNPKCWSLVLAEAPYSPTGTGGPVGWTFAPGSSVALYNGNTVAINVSQLSLIGYYSRN